MISRLCSRTACSKPAVATLTYVHADRTAVVGPLATYAEPHTYDLCGDHAARLTAPRGWEVVRLDVDFDARAAAGRDDLSALADAVRGADTSPAPSQDQAPRRPRRSDPWTEDGRPRLTLVDRS